MRPGGPPLSNHRCAGSAHSLILAGGSLCLPLFLIRPARNPPTTTTAQVPLAVRFSTCSLLFFSCTIMHISKDSCKKWETHF